ncbi:MAG: transposase, partial [Verrucomicrobiae bacterium]|nr:transposase [Verrucomicrobiae bacterium]
AEMFGYAVSEATLQSARGEHYQALEPFEERLVEILPQQPVLHADETSLPINQAKHWLHVVCTPLLTFFAVHWARGKEAIEAIGIIPRYADWLMTDFLSSYLAFDNCLHTAHACRHRPLPGYLDARHRQRTTQFPWRGRTWPPSLFRVFVPGSFVFCDVSHRFSGLIVTDLHGLCIGIEQDPLDAARLQLQSQDGGFRIIANHRDAGGVGGGLESVGISGFRPGVGIVCCRPGAIGGVRIVELGEDEGFPHRRCALPHVAHLVGTGLGSRIVLEPVHDLQPAVGTRGKPDQQIHRRRLGAPSAVVRDGLVNEGVRPVTADLRPDVVRVPEGCNAGMEAVLEGHEFPRGEEAVFHEDELTFVHHGQTVHVVDLHPGEGGLGRVPEIRQRRANVRHRAGVPELVDPQLVSVVTPFGGSAQILDQRAVLDRCPLAGDDLGERRAPTVQAHDAAGIRRKTGGMQLHQGEEVTGIPTAAQNELVRPNLFGHVPTAANVAEVLARIGIAQEAFGQILVRVRNPDGFAALVPERTGLGHARLHRVIGKQPGQRNEPGTSGVDTIRLRVGFTTLVAQVIEELVRPETITTVTGLGGDALKHGDAVIGRAVPTAVRSVGIDRAIGRHFHEEPIPEPFHGGIVVDPVVAGPLVAAASEDDERPHHIAGVVLRHIPGPPEIPEHEFGIPLPMCRFRDVRIPVRRAAFGVGLRHRTMTTTPPFDGFGIPNMEVAAITKPHFAEPGGLRLHYPAPNQMPAIERYQRRRMLELPEPLPFGNLTPHSVVKGLQHGDAGVAPLRFARLRVFHQYRHKGARTVHAAVWILCNGGRFHRIDTVEVGVEGNNVLWNRVEGAVAHIRIGAEAISFNIHRIARGGAHQPDPGHSGLVGVGPESQQG